MVELQFRGVAHDHLGGDQHRLLSRRWYVGVLHLSGNVQLPIRQFEHVQLVGRRFASVVQPHGLKPGLLLDTHV